MIDTPRAGLKTLNHRSDWTTARLKFLFKREARPVLETDEVVTAFRDGIVTLRKNRREDGFTFAELEIGYQGIEPNDLVIHAMDGFAGAIGVSDSRGKGSPVLTIATPIANAEPRFWAYYLRNLAVTGFIQSLAKGIRERSTDFRWKDASNLLVNFPDLATQRAIADFLDRETARIDLLIEQKQRLVSLLGEKAKSVNELFFLNATVSDIQPLHRLYRVVTGKTPSRSEEDNFSDEEGLPWATPANLGFHAPIEKTKERLTEKGCNGQPVVGAGTVLLNGIGTIGKIGIAGTNLSFNQQIHALIAKKEVLSNRFLFFQLLALKEQVVLLANSTTLPILNGERLGRLELQIFDFDEQHRHCVYMDALLRHEDQTAQKINASIDRLKEYRSALITAAVTGQIDVSTYAKSGTPDRHLDAIQEEMGA